MRSRAARVGIGLLLLVPVIGSAGSLVSAAGAGEATGWIALGVGVMWVGLTIWWGMKAPPIRDEEASRRYWAALRNARYRPRNGGEHGGAAPS